MQSIIDIVVTLMIGTRAQVFMPFLCNKKLTFEQNSMNYSLLEWLAIIR